MIKNPLPILNGGSVHFLGRLRFGENIVSAASCALGLTSRGRGHDVWLWRIFVCGVRHREDAKSWIEWREMSWWRPRFGAETVNGMGAKAAKLGINATHTLKSL
jgi:hypothetical protein